MSRRPETYVDTARRAWGAEIPGEVLALAEKADATTAATAARAIDRSAGLVSQILANRYPGDVPTVFARIRGALMGEQVACPVLGDIGRDHCLTEQSRPFAATNATRARVYRACRSGCPHSRLKGI